MWDSSLSFIFLSRSLIPLICCAPTRDHNRVCLLFVSECWCRSPFFLFSTVECPIQVLFVVFLIVVIRFDSLHSLWPAFAAALFLTARGHYQLIDYFDCYFIFPPWCRLVTLSDDRLGKRYDNFYIITRSPGGYVVQKCECVSYLPLICMMLMRMVPHLRVSVCVRVRLMNCVFLSFSFPPEHGVFPFHTSCHLPPYTEIFQPRISPI